MVHPQPLDKMYTQNSYNPIERCLKQCLYDYAKVNANIKYKRVKLVSSIQRNEIDNIVDVNVTRDRIFPRSVLWLVQYRGRPGERDAREAAGHLLLGQTRSASSRRRHACTRHI